MNKCDKKVYVQVLNKFKSCRLKKNHAGWHSVDLIGEKFGTLTVIKLAKSSQRNTRWVAKQGKFLRVVCAASLISGESSGKHAISGYAAKDNKNLPEYVTVTGHHRLIFNSKCQQHKNYKGMPFFNDWNPNKGGAYWKGAKWIIENLGKKPGPEWSIDIIEHKKGFVPGNLRWAKRFVQNYNKRHKLLGKFTIEQLRVEAKRHDYKLVRI